MTINPAKLLGLPSGRLEKGAPADLILVDLGQPWVVDKAQIQRTLQELAVRREQNAGPRARHHGCRQHRLPIRWRRARLMPRAVRKRWSWALIFSVYGLLALLAGYLLGSIPFGLVLTQAAGLGDVRKIGSRQHRRHQRAAHRQQGPGRGHPAARRAQGHRRGAAGRMTLR